MDKKKRNKLIVIMFILTLFIGTELIRNYVETRLERIIVSDDAIVMHNGKKVYKGDTSKYKLENVKSEDIYEIYMDIPKNNISNPAIQFDNINTAVKVYVDNKKVWGIGTNTPKGGIVCHAHNKAPLGDLNGKKQIKMTLRVMNGPTLTNLPTVKLMNTEDIDKDFLTSSLMNIFIAFLMLIIGCVGVLLVVMNGFKDRINKKLFVLSLISLNYFVVIVSWYQIFTVITDNYVLDAILEYDTRYILLVLFGIYMYFSDTKTSENKRIKHIITPILLLIHGVMCTVLQIKRIAYVNDSMGVFLIMALIIMTDVITTFFKNMSRTDRVKFFKVLMGAFIAFGLVLIIIYAFFTNLAVNLFNMMPVCMGLFIISIYVDMIYGLKENYISKAKQVALQEIVYIDRLTGLQNRRGLERYIDYIKKYNSVYAVYSFDMNSLKMINDKYGHMAGDEAIIQFSKILSDVFYDGLCCRVGGDEFFVIIENTMNNTALIEKLRFHIEKYNSESNKEYRLDYAVGKAIFRGKSEDNIYDILNEADEVMYKMKQEMKKASSY